MVEINQITRIDFAKSIYTLSARIREFLDKRNGVAIEVTSDWENLNLEQQIPWAYLASKASDVLEMLEGCNIRDASFELYKSSFTPESRDDAAIRWSEMPSDIKLMWEAITRHCFAIIDCEEIASPDESENLFFEWFCQRVAPGINILIPGE